MARAVADDRIDASWLRRWGLAAAFTFVVGLVLSLVVGVESVAAADRALTADIHGWAVRTAPVDSLARVVTVLGVPVVLGALVALGAAISAIRGRTRLAVWLVVTTALGGMVESAIKLVVGRSRPDLESVLLDPQTKSFPSGHAFNTTVVLGALAIACVVVADGSEAWPRPAWMVAVLAAALLVGISRPLLGVHYVSDVLAGWVLGALWLSLARRATPQEDPGVRSET